ncbi:MAG: DUF1501 domain-containing protein [Betaproteobacteria bacterium]|nr:DUF1501 domain-containing protein [Betaproteobacteria bacterium]
MNRRQFLQSMGWAAGVPLAGTLHGVSWAAPTALSASPSPYENLLILIELKGANDGLNTVIPYADPAYASLRPRLAIARDQVLQLSEREGLHPALQPLMSMWDKKELAVVQGLGYPQPNLSHFRSIEIWDTASKSEEYLDAGWLARTFALAPAPRNYAADGVVVGSSDMGPLSGQGVRTIALADTAQFLRNAKLAQANSDQRNAALKHILAVEAEIIHAAAKLNTNFAFKTEFPRNAFGNQVRTAAQLVASKAGIASIRLTHAGFDTHANQLGTHANLLKDLAEGVAALKSALGELNRWDSTLIMTYAEFGRRPKENQSGGTDHGTANVHFLAGGRVKGGLFGEAPQLTRLDGNGNLPFAVDFRSMYATVIDKWWSGDSAQVLGGKLPALDILRA